MLNHDEMLAGLRHAMDNVGAARVAIQEFPPTATPLAVTASVWAQAHLVIAPHGAGLTNMIFLPPSATVVEVIAFGQTGAVYGRIARELGLKYVECRYNLSEARGRSQLQFVRQRRYTSFVVDVTWLLSCMARQHNITALFHGNQRGRRHQSMRRVKPWNETRSGEADAQARVGGSWRWGWGSRIRGWG